MIRSVAVARIQEGLGFTSRLSSTIILHLQEAQRDLEKGKTLPKFLLQEDETFVLASGTHTVALPAGFLRLDDDNPPHFTPDSSSTEQSFISMKRSLKEAIVANSAESPGAPSVAVIRNSVIDFIVDVSQDYTMTWNYYKAGLLLDSDIENEWLANGAEWLIGLAGYKIAMDLRDKEAVTLFQDMMTRGRAAVFGEIIAAEESSGPLVMGANL